MHDYSMEYSLLLILFILVELGCAAFIFFDKSWRTEIPIDKTGEFDNIYGFLRKNWNICKWVALGAVILQGLIFLLALIVRAANAPADARDFGPSESEDMVKEVERLSCKDVAKKTVRLLRRGQKRDLYKMTRLQMMVNESHLSVREKHTFVSKMNLETIV
nr:tobamovirus multiplication protein 2A-like [Tanacetum cinerariifolium]